MIRPLAPADRVAWRALWRDYLAFYDTELPETVFDTTFRRLTAEDVPEMAAFVAEIGGKPQGLVHYIFHRHCWRPENVVYLQDLYVAPAARGRGAGRALIEAVYAAADAAGSPSVYWMTQEFNQTARRLYDRVAQVTPFIKYQRPL